MKNKHNVIGFIIFTAIFITGCTNLQPATKNTSNFNDINCVGEVTNPPQGMVETNDEQLLNSALGASGEGKLCKGKVFVATEPVKVYRVWNSDKDFTLYGSWWSFDQPEGPRQQYQEENVICPSWSKLDRMSACTLKIGTKLVVGPGQSAKCKDMTYPQSAVNQVFIPNDSRNNVLYVDNCTNGNAWP
ncbi:hypothetical protein [Spartinivicinus poritis]|uniref:Lipoprotein n=1 Tax=Spartinivicinus poritis TaxID=2994640 RepID=A0ABT5UD70_9GAMM|nr:hypothetical protein [Spartinivicinus sp. A2-2]MDE1464316.1 hypothetical protein [Spartinivicinus sp. A2-2]